jgi:Spy/CpxP family protein refolding chaperone
MNITITPRWKIWAAAAALFLSGLAVGSVITVAVGGRIIRKNLEAAASGQGKLIERGADRVHARLVKDLDLNAAQSTAVRACLDTTATKLKAVRETTREEVRQIARSGFVDIYRQLTPAQRDEFRRNARARLERFGFGTDTDALTAEPGKQ